MSAEELPEGLDLDNLAAYIDGAVDFREQVRIEALLAGSEAGREILAEAIRLWEDLDERDLVEGSGPKSSGPGPTSSAGPRRSWTRRPGVLVPRAVAAALVLFFASRRVLPGPSLVETASLQLVGNWAARSWTEYRGGEEILIASESAFRAGALWTGFQASWMAGAPEAGAQATQLITLLEFGTLTSASVAMVDGLRDRANAGESLQGARASVQEADRFLATSSTQPWFDWGRLLEIVRLAAGAGDQDLLASTRLRDALAEPGTEGLEQGEVAALSAVLNELEASPLDLSSLQSALDVAFVELGG